MKKAKAQKQTNRVPVIALVLVFSILGGYFIWKNYFRREEVIDENTEGSAPSEEEQEQILQYEKSCPVQTLIFEAETDDFNVTHVECSEDPRYENIPEGEDVTVEIYTEDFEAGKQEFRNWLADNGLAESDKLRVEYVDK